MKRITKGDHIKCTAHAGQHTGRVVADLGPAGLSIAWNGYTTVPQTAAERKTMRELAAAHDLMMTRHDEVVAA